MATTSLPYDILRTWQRIEFFQPYSLEQRDKSLLISIKQLLQSGDDALPWISQTLRKQYEIPEKASFVLYLGLFEKSLATQISNQILGQEQGLDAQECEQRLDQEGTTCFAKIQLNEQGAPVVDTLSVSSLPWSLGHLSHNRFQEIDSKYFYADCSSLADTLKNVLMTLQPAQEKGPGILRASDILELLNTHLVDWADFKPEWQYALQIDWFGGRVTGQESPPEEEADIEEERCDIDKALALPILNSFFFEDLENVIAALQNNHDTALGSYLSMSAQRNPDLYSQEGLASIIDRLHPAKMPQGRWPSAPGQTMSLMQQFAINTAIEDLAEGGLLSVNGPPGTGKTTLLRELVAHNIVERAKILSGFNSVEETLDRHGFIDSKLTGYEMFIVSSNNAAVENISKELPQKNSLAEEFRSSNYLAPIANQIAAKYLAKRNRKNGTAGDNKERTYHFFHPLEDEKQCWGLISTALGKKANREKFTQRLFFDEHFLRDTPDENIRPDNENFLNLWRWKACHKPISFIYAKEQFIASQKKLEDLLSQLKSYASLLAENPGRSPEALQAAKKQAEMLCEEYSGKRQLLEVEREALEKQIQHAQQQITVIENDAPGWVSRLVNRKKARSHDELLRNAQHQLLNLTEQLSTKVQNIAEQQTLLNDSEANKRNRQKEIELHEQKELTLQKFADQFSDIAQPDHATLINDASLQRTAFWQNAQINRLRSELFIAALELHQAWLYEAMSISRFITTILNLRSFLSAPHKEASPIRWWQTLCMFVPVLSTTFASVGRMLHGVKSEELGWLMIDEAGQASPQQAVGAIWRSKRVLVVGDPLQIEPVFTTPPVLVKHLCQNSLHEHAEDWNPGKLSVQQVADRINPWGCNLDVINTRIWIGIPLWVHRRCIEPMFSLANNLAYNNRMIHGLEADGIRSRSVSEGLQNHWLASKGGQGEKQYRDSHGKSLMTLLDRLLSEKVALQSIYVITPFKSVKSALLALIDQRGLKRWQEISPQIQRKEINEWKKHCVGTVHTFQGKENDIVILVLGCDEENNGGARWAASKPNLLNVALTRAKQHIFVIGDPGVWHTLPGFNRVAKTLQTQWS